MEEIEKVVKAIQQTAEVMREHLEAESHRNRILTVGINGIISLAKEAIEMIELAKRTT
jgi:hypothetical protein